MLLINFFLVDMNMKRKVAEQTAEGDWSGFKKEVNMLAAANTDKLMIKESAVDSYSYAMEELTQKFSQIFLDLTTLSVE
jgi:hypothetical protein